VLLRDSGMHRETRGYAEALDAARCVGERRKNEQEDQREGELCAPQHLVQCSVRGDSVHSQQTRRAPFVQSDSRPSVIRSEAKNLYSARSVLPVLPNPSSSQMTGMMQHLCD
jgi:hypothetical protein